MALITRKLKHKNIKNKKNKKTKQKFFIWFLWSFWDFVWRQRLGARVLMNKDCDHAFLSPCQPFYDGRRRDYRPSILLVELEGQLSPQNI